MARPPTVRARGESLTTCHHRAFYRCSSKHQPCGAASAVVEQQCSLPLMRPTLTHTATWQPRQQPLTGSAAPAQPRAAAEAKDPCSIEAVGEDFPKKRICKVVLLFSDVLGRATHSVGSARGRPRRANIASAMHVCVNTRLSVRVGESDRPSASQMYSDMKYIFCEYLRPFAAREKHAAARVAEKQGDLW
jgi:hypothetical protein